MHLRKSLNQALQATSKSLSVLPALCRWVYEVAAVPRPAGCIPDSRLMGMASPALSPAALQQARTAYGRRFVPGELSCEVSHDADT